MSNYIVGCQNPIVIENERLCALDLKEVDCIPVMTRGIMESDPMINGYCSRMLNRLWRMNITGKSSLCSLERKVFYLYSGMNCYVDNMPTDCLVVVIFKNLVTQECDYTKESTKRLKIGFALSSVEKKVQKGLNKNSDNLP